MFLDASCAGSSAVHLIDGAEYEDVHKSCSPFDFGEAPSYGHDYQNGTDLAHYDVSKVTCKGLIQIFLFKKSLIIYYRQQLQQRYKTC